MFAHASWRMGLSRATAYRVVALGLDLMMVIGALLLIAIGSGLGSSLVGVTLGWSVLWFGAVGVLLLPVPLVLFWDLLARAPLPLAVGAAHEPATHARGRRPSAT